jgi:hypothetical protein
MTDFDKARKVNPDYLELYEKIFRTTSRLNRNNYIHGSKSKSIPETIDEEERGKKLGNDEKEQDIRLKRYTLQLLFVFLALETTVIFIIAFFQGFSPYNFYLDELSFRIVVTATITQITVMLIIAVKHLFPNK